MTVQDTTSTEAFFRFFDEYDEDVVANILTKADESRVAIYRLNSQIAGSIATGTIDPEVLSDLTKATVAFNIYAPLAEAIYALPKDASGIDKKRAAYNRYTDVRHAIVNARGTIPSTDYATLAKETIYNESDNAF